MDSSDQPTGCYADVALGLFMVRGDSVVLLGEVTENNNREGGTEDGGIGETHMKRVSLEELERMKEARVSTSDVEELRWDFDNDLFV